MAYLTSEIEALPRRTEAISAHVCQISPKEFGQIIPKVSDAGKTIFPQAADKVKAFRGHAIEQVLTGNWNPHGTHRTMFYNTAVTGFDVGHGVETAGDPFVNAAVNFSGMLVDLEPFGAFSSQLFFDVMRFGTDGGYCILAPRSSRITARYINFARNKANAMIAGVASVVWQTSFAKADGLRITPFDSRVLKSLAHVIEPEDVLGVTVRFNAYRTRASKSRGSGDSR